MRLFCVGQNITATRAYVWCWRRRFSRDSTSPNCVSVQESVPDLVGQWFGLFVLERSTSTPRHKNLLRHFGLDVRELGLPRTRLLSAIGRQERHEQSDALSPGGWLVPSFQARLSS